MILKKGIIPDDFNNDYFLNYNNVNYNKILNVHQNILKSKF